MRPSWDVYFCQMAQVAATRSTCPRAAVGCVLVSNRHVVSTGFNGSASGTPHCIDDGCMVVDGHCIRSIHAEQNAIIQAALHGTSTFGATAYVTHQPCALCAKMLINTGIVRVVYINEYTPVDGGLFFRQAGVEIERIEL